MEPGNKKPGTKIPQSNMKSPELEKKKTDKGHRIFGSGVNQPKKGQFDLLEF